MIGRKPWGWVWDIGCWGSKNKKRLDNLFVLVLHYTPPPTSYSLLLVVVIESVRQS